jgi:hypothetical protein
LSTIPAPGSTPPRAARPGCCLRPSRSKRACFLRSQGRDTVGQAVRTGRRDWTAEAAARAAAAAERAAREAEAGSWEVAKVQFGNYCSRWEENTDREEMVVQWTSYTPIRCPLLYIQRPGTWLLGFPNCSPRSFVLLL